MTTTHPRFRRRREHGGVTLILVMVLLVLAALIGVLAVRGATSDLQMAGSQRVARRAFYCAEAGLSYARTLVAAHPADWNTILSTGTSGGASPWYPTGGITLDLDNPPDGKPDFVVTMADNADGDAVTHDNDLTVILTSTCSSTTFETNSATRTLSQVITYAGKGGTDYRAQAGHSSTHSGNAN